MTRTDLTHVIAALGVGVADVSTDCNNSFFRYDQKLLALNLQSGALISAGVVNSVPGSQFDFPIYFIPGRGHATALQFDLVLPAGFAFVSTIPGPVATLSQKSIQGATIAGGVRILLFGLNQIEMQQGSLMQIRLATLTSVPSRIYSLSMTGLSGSDPQGNAIVLSSVSGSVILK